jgi:hypothetical protein
MSAIPWTNTSKAECLADELVSGLKPTHYDDHYASKDIEPILVIEETIERLVKSGIDPKDAYNIGQSLKYILRAGVKEGEDVKKDIFKALNYLHRGVRKEWL